MRPPAQTARLVADIGGTHTRFGLVSAPGRVARLRQMKCADHSSVTAAARAYLEGLDPKKRPREAAFAIAGPVRGDRIAMTNRAWSFTVEEVRRELKLERLEVINDFAALALALAYLPETSLREVRPGRREPGAPMVVLGPGTGLGVSVAVPSGEGWTALATEGGHRDLAACSDFEWQVVRRLRERFGRVSAERALSGPGLVNVYESVCAVRGSEPASLLPKGVVDGARDGRWPECVETVALFSGWLGAVAGDLALSVGARGGVFLCGGILPRMGEVFDSELFVESFLDKGRMREYLEPVPVHLIVDREAALLGAARILDRPASGS